MNIQEETAKTVTCVVTIGHNGPDNLPMSETDIADFRTEVALSILKVQTAVYAHGDTKGVFEDKPENGDIWVFTASGHDVRTVLRPQLSVLAAKYRQEAIGLIEQCDTNTLIWAEES